ncbi:barstar family protein [Gordonia sp. CPCC 205333]|uniref:barstar family protein n=1 Tax=Gordonia sp. CPCC 205333 TaxID=3140790 RepID=UPI003AF3DF2B
MIHYRIDGSAISSTKDFYEEIGRSVNGQGGYFGSNLDGLADCLRGSFGTPADDAFEFEWIDSENARANLDGFDDIVAVFADQGIGLHLL